VQITSVWFWNTTGQLLIPTSTVTSPFTPKFVPVSVMFVPPDESWHCGATLSMYGGS
jgi:hypothetical protein